MATFEICRSTNRRYFFHLLASDSLRNLMHSEQYNAKSSCQNGIESVRKNAGNDARYERLTASDGRLYFKLKAANGEVIGVSKMYRNADELEADIVLVKTQAATAAVLDKA